VESLLQDYHCLNPYNSNTYNLPTIYLQVESYPFHLLIPNKSKIIKIIMGRVFSYPNLPIIPPNKKPHEMVLRMAQKIYWGFIILNKPFDGLLISPGNLFVNCQMHPLIVFGWNSGWSDSINSCKSFHPFSIIFVLHLNLNR